MKVRWLKPHKEVAKIGPNMINIVAYGSSHNIFRDNPDLVINAIIKHWIVQLNFPLKR